MKKTRQASSRKSGSDEMLPEYEFDYRKARPNRFARQASGERVVVVLDPDVSKIFSTAEAVNTALRALIAAVPTLSRQKRNQR